MKKIVWVLRWYRNDKAPVGIPYPYFLRGSDGCDGLGYAADAKKLAKEFSSAEEAREAAGAWLYGKHPICGEGHMVGWKVVRRTKRTS